MKFSAYPGQVGITPLPLVWGAQTAEERGPILASRQRASLGLRNAIGAYGGAYSVYHALSVAIGALDPNQRPNYTNTQPTFEVRPNPSWFDPTKIVTLDPWGHLAQTVFKKEIDSGVDIRPTISITRAHLKIAELDDAMRQGRLKVDGTIVIHSATATKATDSSSNRLDNHVQATLNSMISDTGIEVNVSKVAYENVWYLPGVAHRLEVTENSLRRCLFEDTGGMCTCKFAIRTVVRSPFERFKKTLSFSHAKTSNAFSRLLAEGLVIFLARPTIYLILLRVSRAHVSSIRRSLMT